MDVGKPFLSALGDVTTAISQLRYYAGWTDKIDGRTITGIPNNFSFTISEPVGVVGIITPWNFPLMVAILKISPGMHFSFFYLANFCTNLLIFSFSNGMHSGY